MRGSLALILQVLCLLGILPDALQNFAAVFVTEDVQFHLSHEVGRAVATCSLTTTLLQG